MAKFSVAKEPEYGKGKPKKSVTFRLSIKAIEQLEYIAREMRWTKTTALEACILEAPLPRIDFDKFTRPVKKEKP